MAFVRSNIRDRRPRSTFGIILGGFGSLLRWLAIPAIGLALACWCALTFASLYSATSIAPQESIMAQSLKLPAKIGPGDPRSYVERDTAAAPVLAAVSAGIKPKPERVAVVAPQKATPLTPAVHPAPADPFAALAAKVSRDKVLAALERAGMTINYPSTETNQAQEVVVAALDDASAELIVVETLPLPDRFGPKPAANTSHAETFDASPVIAQPGPTRPAYAMASALSAEASWGSLARLLVEEPAVEQPVQVAAIALPEVVEKPARRPKPEQAEPQALAFAKPDNPVDPKPFNKLFNRQDKVAIYDISAGIVHMPDGSKLEAHSGIGKMADNPKYVHVRNNGPTPPNTYNLKMRESRFYGVEAIRMTPITDQPMHGRDGFLTHSYLLRSRRPESHGCVAFKNYPLFLKAFKQGKVKQLVVVPSLKEFKARKGRTARDA